MILKLKSDNQILFDSTTDEYEATAIDLTEQVNTTNTLEFTIPPFNPNYNLPQNMTSLIELYENNVLRFEGRVLYSQKDMLGNKTYTCEGSLAFLLDSVVRPNTTQNTTILEYFTYLINQHNSQVEAQKQFQVGIVTVTNSTDNVYRIDNDYQNTLTVIQEKLVNRLGGYLRVRKVNGVRYIDYLEEYGTTSTQTIEFQKNILDLSERISAENVITALIPLGAKDEATELPLTIASVNDGKDYIVDETAVSLFGYIYGTNTWDDVTVASNLLTKGQEFLKENIKNSVSIEVSAVDLSMLNSDINVLELGMSVPVISQPHNLNSNFVIKKKETQFLKPEDSSITLDTVIKRNTDQMTTTDRELVQQTQVTIPNLINDVVKNQTSLITGGQGGYVVFGYNANGQPEELYFLDQPTTATAQNIIRINKNGIGFSNNGFNGPYNNAWTIDGVLNASFIATGKLVGLTIEGNTIIGGTITGSNIQTQQDITVGKNIIMYPQNINDTDRLIDMKSFVVSAVEHDWNTNEGTYSVKNKNATSTNRSRIQIYHDSANPDVSNINLSVDTPSNDTTLSVFGQYVSVSGDLTVSGQKNRVVETSKGKVKMNAVESTFAMFEDFGESKTNNEGVSIVKIDKLFRETVSLEQGYFVFLQSKSDGKLYVSSKVSYGFVVRGTPNTKYEWRITAKQKGYEKTRMEILGKGR